MKKYVLLLLVLFFLLITPTSADKKEFLAVFSNPGTYEYWEKWHPDLYFTAKDWDDLPSFLRMAKTMGDGKDIALDIDCHGSSGDGNLYLDYGAFGHDYLYGCSVGALLNKIEESGIAPKRVYLEACFSELCAEKSFKADRVTYLRGDLFENYKYGNVNYPMYGIGTCPNLSNLIYLQDKYSVKPFFVDLRDYLGKTPEEPDKSPEKMQQLDLLFDFLYVYGQ